MECYVCMYVCGGIVVSFDLYMSDIDLFYSGGCIANYRFFERNKLIDM
jgi:hypothetical protein